MQRPKRALILLLLSCSAVAQPKTQPITTLKSPADFIKSRVEKIDAVIQDRPLRSIAAPNTHLIRSPMSTQGWLKQVYLKNIVEASTLTELLSDKLLFYEIVKKYLGSSTDRYLTKTEGIREFLESHNFLDTKGRIDADGETIEKKLFEEFPAGFVVRPAVGVAPTETTHGIFKTTDDFVVSLLSSDSKIYSPEQLSLPVKSHILDRISSGELAVLQEDLIYWADAKKPLRHKTFFKLRLHTYEDKIVDQKIIDHFSTTHKFTPQEFHAAVDFVNSFLALLPKKLVLRQAWAIEVAVFDNGEMKILDVLTNRGQRGSWSAYLDQPRVLGAYTRHFEQQLNFKFAGIDGVILRNDLGNFFSFWQKKIDHSQNGWQKMKAFLLPPL